MIEIIDGHDTERLAAKLEVFACARDFGRENNAVFAVSGVLRRN